ncbi:MAG: T9SS type A sorting domain-containing protein [Ferruginibacter sp.]
MKKCLLLLFWAIYVTPSFSQSVNTGTLAITDQTFNRPEEGTPPTALSITGTSVFYNVITFNVAVPGLVTISSLSVWDNFMILYNSNGFNPLTPLENALVANDDFTGPNAGISYSFTTPGTYTIVICSYKNGVTGEYTVTTSAPVPLPLRLLSFSASKSAGNTNTIKWSSTDESNLSTYQVQLSTNNTSFADLKYGSIAAKNNSNGASYNFTDKNPMPGFNYYRLKIIERSGIISYSPVALVRNTRAGIKKLNIFPNPSSDFIRIEAKSLASKKALITVINAAGSVMHSGQYSFNNQAILSVNIMRFPSGKYFLRATIDGEENTMVFIKY